MQYRSLIPSRSTILSFSCGGALFALAGCMTVVVDGSSGGSGGGTTTTTTSTAGSGGSTSSECPAMKPAFNGTDSCSNDGQTCQYGEQCCDGNCYAAIACFCADLVWYCSPTDACLAPPGCDSAGPDDDADGDGYTEIQGDCDDCQAAMNPGAVEVIAGPDENGVYPPPADEDCDGLIDEADPDLQPCDSGLPIDSADPFDAAAAIGLCDTWADGSLKFIQGASWVLADGSAPGPDVDMAKYHLGHGLLDHFGANDTPREGSAMLALSSGTARNKDDLDFVSRNFDKGYSSLPPSNFSGDTAACPGVVVPTESVQDAAALEIKLLAPTNAKGIEFQFHYRTYDFPTYVCTPFADFFWTSLLAGNFEESIARDGLGNPITANSLSFGQCDCPPAGPGQCQLPSGLSSSCDGVDLLQGTDFMGDTNPISDQGWTNGGTGWLKSSAIITPNQPFKLRFTIFDSGISNGVPDHNVDSTVTIDGFHWLAEPGYSNDLQQ